MKTSEENLLIIHPAIVMLGAAGLALAGLLVGVFIGVAASKESPPVVTVPKLEPPPRPLRIARPKPQPKAVFFPPAAKIPHINLGQMKIGDTGYVPTIKIMGVEDGEVMALDEGVFFIRGIDTAGLVDDRDWFPSENGDVFQVTGVTNYITVTGANKRVFVVEKVVVTHSPPR